MLQSILIPTLTLGSLALVFGYILGYAAKVFQVQVDERVDKIVEALPGANCGSCGFPGCNGYAEAIVEKDADINLCPPGGAKVANNIAEIMGKTASDKEKLFAIIHCASGGYHNTNIKYEYNGITSCKAVSLLSSGINQCNYGCVFQNDCIKACKFGAISLNKDGIKIINKDKCTGCSACSKVCPRALIRMVPISKTVSIPCSSKDKGVIAKKNCGNSSACIGCGLCAKKCPFQAIHLDNHLVRIDYEKCMNCGLCVLQCPTKIIKDTHTRGKATIDFHKCIGCTMCAKRCVVSCISGELKRLHVVDREKCIGCEICIQKCPKAAITIT